MRIGESGLVVPRSKLSPPLPQNIEEGEFIIFKSWKPCRLNRRKANEILQ